MMNHRKRHRPACVLALLIASCICWASSVGAQPTVGQDETDPTIPTSITYRGTFVNALPFVRATEIAPGEYEYAGVEPDMLDAMKEFAAADGIELNFELTPGFRSYNGALDLVANDCNTTANPNTLEDCNRFDIIIADFFQNPARSRRVELSPAFFKSAISTLKKTEKTILKDVTTLNQASKAGIPVCMKQGTYYATVVEEKFPDVKYLYCDNQDLCLDILKNEECGLYVDNELQCRYRAANDPLLAPTPESFNTQYIVWAIKDNTPHARWLRKWIYQLGSTGTMDRLFFKYFSKELCPVGTAGESCELPCDPDHGQSDPSGKCICTSAKWKGDDCTIEVLENRNLVPFWIKVAAYAMFCISGAIILFCAGWLFWKRSTVQVRVMQPFFLCLILLGCLISTSTILVLTEDDQEGKVPHCELIPWLYSVGFCVTFGTLFAKIRRTYIMFKSAVAFQRVIVTSKETLSIIGAVLLVDCIILAAWTVVSPLEWQREVISADVFGVPLESIGYCTSDNWIPFASPIAVLHLVLMTAACILCYVSRGISSEFSEGKYLSIAMVSNLQLYVVGVPVLILVGKDPVTGFLLRTFVVWINDLAVVILLFGHLMYLVHWGPKTNEVGTAVGRSMAKYKNWKSSRVSFQGVSAGSGSNSRESFTRKQPERADNKSNGVAGNELSETPGHNNGRVDFAGRVVERTSEDEKEISGDSKPASVNYLNPGELFSRQDNKGVSILSTHDSSKNGD